MFGLTAVPVTGCMLPACRAARRNRREADRSAPASCPHDKLKASNVLHMHSLLVDGASVLNTHTKSVGSFKIHQKEHVFIGGTAE